VTIPVKGVVRELFGAATWTPSGVAATDKGAKKIIAIATNPINDSRSPKRCWYWFRFLAGDLIIPPRRSDG
jgi:hypothetical protein